MWNLLENVAASTPIGVASPETVPIGVVTPNTADVERHQSLPP